MTQNIEHTYIKEGRFFYGVFRECQDVKNKVYKEAPPNLKEAAAVITMRQLFKSSCWMLKVLRRCRQYNNKAANKQWCHYKHIPYGIVINGYVDGFS